MVPLHASGRPQASPLANCVQAPLPLQIPPTLPQGGLAGQRPCGSLRPPVTLAQMPLAVPHVWQVPHELVKQQIPSTQLPLVHWLVAVHEAPFPPFATQVPALQ